LGEDILRKMCGPVTEEGVSGTVTSNRAEEVCETTDLAADIKMKRLVGLEHMIRMDEIRVAKEICESKPKSKRKVVRPTLRRLDDVENDLREP
jgi:hypothetical protein